MARMLYQGHASFRFISDAGVVVYVDPYAGEGYDVPADAVLITHDHFDHNQLSLVTLKPGARVITQREALVGGTHQSFALPGGIAVEALPACNKNHREDACVGYLLSLDGARVYIAGDTSETRAMPGLAARDITHALLPIDGVYNMDAREASRCAKLIGARCDIPIHMKPGALFDLDTARTFESPRRRIVRDGEEIEL